MLQSSIATWLKRPAAVQTPPKAQHAEGQDRTRQEQFPQAIVPLTVSKELKAIVPAASAILNPETHLAPRASSLAQATTPLPSNATLEFCTQKYVASFQRLTSLLLPIPYSKSFYADTVRDPVIASLSRVAIWHDAPPTPRSSTTLPSAQTPSYRVVGGIRCRLLPEQVPVLYISTIGVLAPFRHHGLATHLLNAVIQIGIEEYGVREVVAHVWEANVEGMEWYKKRGFQVVRGEENYYPRLKPQTAAWVIKRTVGVIDAIGQSKG